MRTLVTPGDPVPWTSWALTDHTHGRSVKCKGLVLMRRLGSLKTEKLSKLCIFLLLLFINACLIDLKMEHKILERFPLPTPKSHYFIQSPKITLNSMYTDTSKCSQEKSLSAKNFWNPIYILYEPFENPSHTWISNLPWHQNKHLLILFSVSSWMPLHTSIIKYNTSQQRKNRNRVQQGLVAVCTPTPAPKCNC